MPVSDYFIYNEKFYRSDEKIISAYNRAFRYGDGFFETMKMIDGKIILEEFHIARLFSSLRIMQFDKPEFFTPEFLLQQIKSLVEKNVHQQLARIRLMIFRGDGNIYNVENNEPNYIIQSWLLPNFSAYNEQGFTIDIYKEARKSADVFSVIKSNNYLPYAMAAIWSKKQRINDALVMNCYGRIAEATTSNIFIVKNKKVQTPALSEGCIGGVVRRYLIEQMRTHNIEYEETVITIEQVLAADEVFLTNSGWYLQWVKQCGVTVYTDRTSRFLYEKFIIPIVKNK